MVIDIHNTILNEYLNHFNDKLESISLQEGKLLSLLSEAAFTGKSFSRMIEQLVKIERMLPEEMENSLEALRRAIDDAEKKYAKLIRRKISKEDFTKMVAQTKGLADGLARGISELQTVMRARKIKKRVNSRLGYDSDGDGAGDTLGDVLDDNHKDILKARLELAFTQPEGMVGKLWKMLSPKSYGWHGLTDEKLITDVMSLTREGLKTLFGEKFKEDIDELLPEKVEDVIEDEAESMLPDEVAGSNENTADESSVPEEDDGESSTENESPYKLSIANTVTQGPARDRTSRPKHVSYKTHQDRINKERAKLGLKPFSYLDEPVQDLTDPDLERRYVDFGEEDAEKQPEASIENNEDKIEDGPTIVPDESSAEPEQAVEKEGEGKAISLKQFLKDYAGARQTKFDRKKLAGLVGTLRRRGFKVIDDLDESVEKNDEQVILERWRRLAGII